MPWVRAKCKDCGEIVIRPIGEEVICKGEGCGRRFRIPNAPEAYVIPRQIRSIPDLTSTGRTRSPKVSTLRKGIGRPEITSGGRIGSLKGASPGTQESWEVKPLPQTGPKRQAVLEHDPLVDVFDEEDQILVVAELPGVREEDIEVETEDQMLILKTKGKRKYHREIELPCEVGEYESRYQNGILELRFPKKT